VTNANHDNVSEPTNRYAVGRWALTTTIREVIVMATPNHKPFLDLAELIGPAFLVGLVATNLWLWSFAIY